MIINKNRTAEIARARELVKLRAVAKDKICEICANLCEYHGAGGRVPVGAYTTTQFAADIGINPATLRNWMTDYRKITSKIPKKLRKPSDAGILRLISRDAGFTNDTPARLVTDEYLKRISERSGESYKLELFIKNSQDLLFFLQSHALDLFDEKLIGRARDANLEILESIRGVRKETFKVLSKGDVERRFPTPKEHHERYLVAVNN